MENESFMKDFKKIIVDMTKDILISFPELAPTMNLHLKNVVTDNDESGQSIDFVFKHCMKTYPDKFFDILYQNDTIFTNEKNDADFLPDIDFKLLWKENLTDKTRETIWKYLQLVLFTIVSNKETFTGESFGNTAKLFEAINEEEFKSKLEETIAQMKDVFDMSGNSDDSSETPFAGKTSGINLEDLPNAEDLHEHVTKMMDGKLGKLAREIAEETAADLNIDMENAESMNDVFKRLFKNPTKLMSLVKNVGSKLDEKLKKGDINETELLKEASEMMQHMKNMPGMKDMMSKMGMGGGKMNMGAMQSNLEKSMRSASQKDRMRAKLAASQLAKSMQEQQQAQQKAQQQAQQTQGPVEELVFSTGEQVERSQKKPKNKKKKTKN
jgi:hypothetical protein